MVTSRTRIAAAGGVVWRRGDQLEVALVHRPRYDDWSLPKGKLTSGETLLAGAVREVGEELGAIVAVSRRLIQVRYEVDAEPKAVTYWAMRYLGGEFASNTEVDAVVWATPDAALERMSHDADRSVLAEFSALPVPDSVIVLVRHAKAGKRTEWQGDDALRPLDLTGRRQAKRLAGFLTNFAPDQIVAADRTRCIQTVQPLADQLGLTVQVEHAFADESYVQSPSATRDALLALAKPGRATVLCSQGLTIPALIDELGIGITTSDTRKGAAWVLSMVDGEVVATDYYDGAARD